MDRPCKSVEDHFLIWDSLIKKLSKHQSNFLRDLTEEIVREIILSTSERISNDQYREAMTMWLEHIFTSNVYRPVLRRAKLGCSGILSACLSSPSRWTLRLARSMMEAPGNDVEKAMYDDRFRLFLQDEIKFPEQSSNVQKEDTSTHLPSWHRPEITSHTAEPASLTDTATQGNVDAEGGSRTKADGIPLMDSDGYGVRLATNETATPTIDTGHGQSQVGGWQKWEGKWRCKPIGMV